jgi:hypothetical protein
LAHAIPARLSAAEGRKFAITVGAAFSVVGAVLWWRGMPRAAVVLWVIAGSLLLAGLIIPGNLTPIHRGWMGLALLISRVTTPLFLGAIYYLVLTPFGVVRRALGKNSLVRAETGGSFWVSREDGGRSKLERQF